MNMQTLFELGFVLAMTLPAVALVLSAGTVLTSAFVYWRSHADRPAAEPGTVAVHHPVGR